MARRMKKFIAFLCASAALMLSLFTFAGCGTYIPPSPGGQDTPVDPHPGGDKPDDPDKPSPPEEQPFTVQLIAMVGGGASQNFDKNYYERMTSSVNDRLRWEQITVQWTDMQTGEVHRKSFDEDGKAEITGLDGEYKVTLATVPTGFTYEPNTHDASNLTRDVEIELYRINPNGDLYDYNNGMFKYYTISATGAYSAVLNSPDEIAVFFYNPGKHGMYSFRSMVDVTANRVNPILNVYNGVLPFYMTENPFATQDDGGAENTYTKNIYWQYILRIDEVGGSGFIFSLSSTCIDDEAFAYPLTVNFILERDGDFSRTDEVPEVQVTEDFTKTPPTPEGRFIYAVDRPGVVNKTLDMRTVILNTPKGRGNKNVIMQNSGDKLDDGYYYYFIYDETTDTYTLTDRLYAVINRAIAVEPDFLKLTFQFLNGYNYYEFVLTYRRHCNSDGCYPVNEELALFFRNFAISKRLFNDGAGSAEVDFGYNSDEDSQWMVGCGYYG